MNAEEFKKRWTESEDNLNPININRLNELGLSKSTIDFLTTAGLPYNSAPYLSFSKDSEDIYQGINKLTKVYNFLEPEFEKYIVIGSCSDGDPIVINTENNDSIEYLDHEDYFSSRPFNSCIYSIAECLIAYRNFVSVVLQENGEDAYLNSDFSDEHFTKLKQDLLMADTKIMCEKGFWNEQIEMDFHLREDSLNEKESQST